MQRNWINSALRACVSEHNWSRPPDGLAETVAGRDVSALAERADYHGVSNLAYLSLRSIESVDSETLAVLERRYLSGNARHLRALVEIANVEEVLGERGIPWLVFKGPILAEFVYPRADLRSYLDLDIVVRRQDFATAVEALQDEGSKLLDRNWELLLRREVGQLHVELPFGTLADLHWHVLNRAEIRRSMTISMDDLFDRARKVTLNDTSVLTFDPVDSLLHLCVHTALSGGVRLAWLKDIERSIASQPISWDNVVERARDWGVATLVAAVIARARRVFGIRKIPDDLLPALAPSRWGRAADAALDALWPAESIAGPRGPSVFWMRYRRETLGVGRDTLVARLSARGWGHIIKPAPIEPDEAVHFSIPSGDERTRAAFFDLVSGRSSRVIE